MGYKSVPASSPSDQTHILFHIHQEKMFVCEEAPRLQQSVSLPGGDLLPSDMEEDTLMEEAAASNSRHQGRGSYLGARMPKLSCDNSKQC